MEDKRKIDVHAGINRPHLILGADRTLVLASAGVCLLLGMTSFTIADFSHPMTTMGPLAAAVIWGMLLLVWRRLAKADPLMWRAYIRHVRYNGYYPARSGMYAEADRSPRRWV